MSASVILIHGAFADASGWGKVITALQAAGVKATGVANPLRGLTHDGEYVKSVVSQTEGDVVLVGHSYGGAVATYAGSGQDNVKAMVFVSSFGLDSGENIDGTAKDFPDPELPAALRQLSYPGSDVPELLIRVDEYHRVFAADLSEEDAAVGAATQRPFSVHCLQEPLAVEPAWKSVPSWWVVGTADRAINPDYQRSKAGKIGAKLTEIAGGSHSTFVSHADEVTKVILEAVASTAP